MYLARRADGTTTLRHNIASLSPGDDADIVFLLQFLRSKQNFRPHEAKWFGILRHVKMEFRACYSKLGVAIPQRETDTGNDTTWHTTTTEKKTSLNLKPCRASPGDLKATLWAADFLAQKQGIQFANGA